jgi:hypothetical protein
MVIPTTPGWNLAQMRSTFRAVGGVPSPDQLSDPQVNSLLNNFYVYKMPFELKEQITDQFLTFKTTPGIDVYSFPSGYFTDSPGAYADGFPLVFYQDPDIFFQDWPQQYAVDNIATGDGVTTVFTGGLQNPPVIIGTLFITADDPTGFQQLLTDDGDGTLSGNGTGTINYLTGAYSATFNTAPAMTANIYAKYQGYSGNRPQGVLFFNNEFTLRPVPDQAYQILMQGYIQPITLVNDDDTPLQPEWGPLIVFGAALDWFLYNGDVENYDRYYPQFKRFENVALGRTIQQLTEQQSVPRF